MMLMQPIARTISRLFPDTVTAHTVPIDAAPHIAEGALPLVIQRSVSKRREEFIAGRFCALVALQAAGAPTVQEVKIGPSRAPIWPTGFVGSITHAAGLAAAVAAKEKDAASLGIDIEAILAAPAILPLIDSIARRDELNLVVDAVGDPGLAFTLIFATKEALFKCLSPLVGRYFDFLDVEVISVGSGTLTFRFLATLNATFPAGLHLKSNFARVEEIVIAGVFLEPNVPRVAQRQ
jgi:enterobactin synthetase component D